MKAVIYFQAFIYLHNTHLKVESAKMYYGAKLYNRIKNSGYTYLCLRRVFRNFSHGSYLYSLMTVYEAVIN